MKKLTKYEMEEAYQELECVIMFLDKLEVDKFKNDKRLSTVGRIMNLLEKQQMDLNN